MAEAKVYVWANPYGCLDHRGWLAGATPLDPKHGGGVRMHVSATFVALSVEKRGPADNDGRDDHQESAWEFSAEPLEIPFAPGRTYHGHVKAGCLIVGKKDAPPLEQLAAARAKAVADWKAAYGEEPLPYDKWSEQYPLEKDVRAFGRTPATNDPKPTKAPKES